VTELAVFGFDDKSKRMKVLALNPGITREEVQDNTGFDLVFNGQTGVTEPPTEHELTALRTLDPDRLFTA
jgi:glutaconate CoA-transferase subunit B